MLRYMCIMLFAFCNSIPAAAQLMHNPVPASYSNDLQRFLVIATGNYLYNVRQGEIDTDSAMLLAANVYNLNFLLPYTEANENKSAGCQLLKYGKLLSAKQLLPTLTGEAKIQLLRDLGSFYLFQPGTTTPDLDSAGKYIRLAYNESIAANSKTWQRKTLVLLGKYYWQANQQQQGIECFTRNLQECRGSNDSGALANALFVQATYLPFGHPSKQAMFQEAKGIFDRSNQPLKAVECETGIAVDYFYTDKHASLEKMLNILEREKKMGFLHLQFAHQTLSYLYMNESQFITAFEHAEESIKYMTLTKDSAFSSLYCVRLAQLMSNLGKTDESAYWNERSLSIHKTRDNQAFWYKSFLSKATNFRIANRPSEALSYMDEIEKQFPASNALDQMYLLELKGDCYNDLKDDQKALACYNQATAISDKIPPHFLHEDVTGRLPKFGLFFFSLKDYNTARQYLARLNAIPEGTLNAFNKRNKYLLQFKLDSLDQKYIAAIQDHQLFMNLHDTFMNMKQREQIDALLVKYEASKKDNDIKLLRRDSELQQSRLEQSNTTRNVTLTLLALVFIILSLLYNQYRIKQKANRETEQKNIALQKLVEEKEWLLKEVHHRVKNNLQTVVSLLESQSAYLQDDALLAIQESQNRVYAMSLLHQKLYQSKNVAAINMGNYLPDLVNHLRDCFNLKQNIRFQLNIAPIELDVSLAVPIGLIVNEAITNSIKYAFKETSNNIISVEMKLAEGNMVQLSIADNGIGLPPDFDKNSSGLGLRLMKGLTEDISGSFEIKHANGTGIYIAFKENFPLYKIGDLTTNHSFEQTG